MNPNADRSNTDRRIINGLKGISNEFSDLEHRINHRLDDIEDGIAYVDGRIDILESKIRKIETRALVQKIERTECKVRHDKTESKIKFMTYLGLAALWTYVVAMSVKIGLTL
jgi:hypothetical protein